MSRQSSTSTSSNLAPIVTIAGGLLVVGGVAVDWFQAGDITYSGTEDWTGVGALVVGVIVILGGLAAMDMFVRDAGTRRFGALVATAGGILAVFLVALGFIDADGVVAGGSASLGLYISGVGAVFGVVAGWMSTQAIPGGSG